MKLLFTGAGGALAAVTHCACAGMCCCCSKDFHNLLEVALQYSNAIDTSSTKEAWGYVVEVIEIVETKAKVSQHKHFTFVEVVVFVFLLCSYSFIHRL